MSGRVVWRRKRDLHTAPSPTITSFLRISAMLRCLLEVLVEVGKVVSLAMVCWVRSLEVEVERRGKQKHIVSVCWRVA